jgi:hypothetical protein
MADNIKAPFWAQVTAVVLIVVVGLLCLPTEDGLLITRLTGTTPQRDRVPPSSPSVVPVTAVPVEAVAPASTYAPVPAPVATPSPSSFPSRFSQALDLFPQYDDPLAPPQPAWVEAQKDGRTIWVDTASLMAWGPRLDAELTGMTKDDLDLARSFCDKEKPEGAWALPTAAEFDIAKVNGMLTFDKGARHKWLTWQEVPPALVIPSVRGYVPASAGENYSVRCIARTQHAPDNGYLQAGNEITLKALAE